MNEDDYIGGMALATLIVLTALALFLGGCAGWFLRGLF